jgi:hypothetical protein
MRLWLHCCLMANKDSLLFVFELKKLKFEVDK